MDNKRMMNWKSEICSWVLIWILRWWENIQCAFVVGYSGWFFFQPPPFYIAPSRLHLAVSTFTFSSTASFSFRHVSHATWILNRRSNFHVIWRVASLLILSLMNWAKLIFWAFVYPLLNQSTKSICLVWKVSQWEFGAYIYSPTLRD